MDINNILGIKNQWLSMMDSYLDGKCLALQLNNQESNPSDISCRLLEEMIRFAEIQKAKFNKN